MVPTVPAVLVALLSLWWMTSQCEGRLVVVDVSKTEDDEWPVLCPPETFYNKREERCVTCSMCPVNTIIVSPCQGVHDTRCGPFYDFNDFLPGAAMPAEKQNADADNFRDLQTTQPTSEEKSMLKKENGSREVVPGSDKIMNDDVDASESGEWRSLTLTLAIVVSLTTIVIVCAVIAIVRVVRRRRQNNGKLSCDYSRPPQEV